MNIPRVLFFAVKRNGRLLHIERGNYLGIPFWENPADMPLVECARRAIEPSATIIDLGEPTSTSRFIGEWNGVESWIEVYFFCKAVIIPRTK
ncbi:MAG: hypothetical protein RLZZ67_399 [Candidatus Parcubacteria bacterium]|jgi:hypothetical protein